MQTEFVQPEKARPIIENINDINGLINTTNKTLVLDFGTGKGSDRTTVLLAGDIISLTPELRTNIVNAVGTISFIKQGFLAEATLELEAKVDEMCHRCNRRHRPQRKMDDERNEKMLVGKETILRSYETIIENCYLTDQYRKELAETFSGNVSIEDNLKFAESFRQKNIVEHFKKVEQEEKEEIEEFNKNNPGKELIIESCKPFKSSIIDVAELAKSVKNEVQKTDNSEVILPDEEILW